MSSNRLVGHGGPEILFGPFGTQLKEGGRLLGIPDLANSASILNGGFYRQAVGDVAREYAPFADVAATHTFDLRTLLGNGRRAEYREALKAHHAVITEVLAEVRSQTGRNLKLFISCGPKNDCYEADQAPDAPLARDFHAEQLAVIRELPGVDQVLFETVCAGREALGIARAARDLNVSVIISFVVDAAGKLLSGESVHDVIGAIEGEVGSHPRGYSLNCCPIAGVWNGLDDSNGYRNRVIMAYPNASNRDPRDLQKIDGVARVDDHLTRASELVRLSKERGLEIVGGCCGFDENALKVLARSVADSIEGSIVAA